MTLKTTLGTAASLVAMLSSTALSAQSLAEIEAAAKA